MAVLSGGKATRAQPSAFGCITVPFVDGRVIAAIATSPIVMWLRQGPAKEPGA